MFFLGGMTMGYLDPRTRAECKDQMTVSMRAEKDWRQIETSNPPQNENAVERSLIWAWRTLC
ncbi:hypothetical protein AMC90_CH04230 [Rhizobium phaseoli]|nr:MULTISPECIES: hypothetical protein [Rhizobium]MDH6648841.1 hypothetical protein [Rhizobium esperanzae]ANL29977.1 hypothetical protein AMC90_CH04230 [Rhizobium phaseoli]ANL42596.1 hypothetical protein AMC88_CH04265 [Rhizobium phaseoli]ANL55274.1 hypothetical protein AMC86_CH04196 [Rhizobium phaseoli]ANL61582.1 hypothetical protein AMC85_CH04262 [Rhizobium phaseoli]